MCSPAIPLKAQSLVYTVTTHHVIHIPTVCGLHSQVAITEVYIKRVTGLRPVEQVAGRGSVMRHAVVSI